MNACESDALSEDMPLEEDCQTLVINLSSTGDGLTTRAGRPLLSAAANQLVDEVILFVVQQKKNGKEAIVLQKRFSWKAAKQYDLGKKLTIQLRKTQGEQLPIGTYTLYAVGFAPKSDYWHYPFRTLQESGHTIINAIVNECTAIDENKMVEVDFEKDFYSLLQQDIRGGEEIFAGKSVVQALEKSIVYPNGLDAAIVLNRQVAGTLGYFNNIPAKVGDEVPERLRLVAAHANDQVNFVDLVQGETHLGSLGSPRYVINGSNHDIPLLPTAEYADGIHEGYVVYDIALKDFYAFGGATGRADFAACDLDNDGYVGVLDAQKFVTGYKVPLDYTQTQWEAAIKAKPLDDFWKNPYAATQQLVAGSVLGGSFLIPFRWVENQSTFELQLLGPATGTYDNILKAWPVKIKAEDLHHEPGDLPVPDVSTGIIPEIKGDWSVNCFNVYRNHFYALGVKTSDGSGETLVRPDADNYPKDLNTSHELLIKINAQWEVVEDMTLK